MNDRINKIKEDGANSALWKSVNSEIEEAKKYLAHAYGRIHRIRAALMDAEEAIKRAHESLNELEK